MSLVRFSLTMPEGFVDFRNRQRAVEAARLDADKSAQPKTRLLSHVAVPDDGQTHNVVAGPATVVEGVR